MACGTPSSAHEFHSLDSLPLSQVLGWVSANEIWREGSVEDADHIPLLVSEDRRLLEFLFQLRPDTWARRTAKSRTFRRRKTLLDTKIYLDRCARERRKHQQKKKTEGRRAKYKLEGFMCFELKFDVEL